MVELAQPGDPLVTTSGKVVNPTEVNGVDVTSSEATRRQILPFSKYRPPKDIAITKVPEADPQEQSLLTLIVGYRLMGLSDTDMAEYMGVSLAKIREILDKSSIQKTFEMIVRGVIDTNSVLIQGRISSHANSAANVVVNLMEDVEIRPDVRLKAAQDVLDRSGTNADQYFREADDRSGQNDSIIIETYVGDDSQPGSTKVTVNKGK